MNFQVGKDRWKLIFPSPEKSAFNGYLHYNMIFYWNVDNK